MVFLTNMFVVFVSVASEKEKKKLQFISFRIKTTDVLLSIWPETSN